MKLTHNIKFILSYTNIILLEKKIENNILGHNKNN